MIISKLTKKAKTTIPQPVRAALQLQEGDKLAHLIEGSRVILTKVDSVPHRDPFPSFTEWDSDPDKRGYADLSAE